MIWMIKCQCREAILMELRGVWSLEVIGSATETDYECRPSRQKKCRPCADCPHPMKILDPPLSERHMIVSQHHIATTALDVRHGPTSIQNRPLGRRMAWRR